MERSRENLHPQDLSATRAAGNVVSALKWRTGEVPRTKTNGKEELGSRTEKQEVPMRRETGRGWGDRAGNPGSQGQPGAELCRKKPCCTYRLGGRVWRGGSGEDGGGEGVEWKVEEGRGLRGGLRRKYSGRTEGSNLHYRDSSHTGNDGLFEVRVMCIWGGVWDLWYWLICVCQSQSRMLPPYALLSCVASSAVELRGYSQG